MFKSKILQKAVFLFTIILIGYIVSIGIFILPKINSTIQTLEEKSAKKVLDKIATLSKSTMKDLKIYKENSLKRYKDELKLNVEIVWTYIDEKYNQIGVKGTSKELKDEVIEMVLKMGVGDSIFALIDYNSVILSHPFAQGVDASKNTDIKGEYSINIMADIAQTKGEGFHTYWYYKHKYKYTQKSYQKLSFVKDYPKWNMFISTGVFINRIRETSQKREDEFFTQLEDIIKNTKIAQTGYIYIFDKTGKIIIHPNKAMIGKIIDKQLHNDLIKSSKLTKELIYKDKIFWIESIPELDLYVISNTNIDEFKQSSKSLNNNIILLGFIVLIIAIFASILIFKRFLKPILTLSKLTNKVTYGDLTVRSNINTNDEIGNLSKDFNKMIETIEQNKYKDKLLFQQSKLASMGEMIGNIAHQWRQPVNRVNLSLAVIDDIVKQDNIDKQKVKDKINISQKNLQYMSNTIEDFASFFRPDKQMILFNIQKIISSLIGLLDSRLDKIEFIYDKKDIKINSYENELLQVLLIIFNNALDNFEIKNTQNQKIEILLKEYENIIKIDIIDNGGGITKENIDKIFDPYFTTKFKDEGTGIGLYMAKMIIEDSMGGNLSVNSHNGITTFKIEIGKENDKKEAIFNNHTI